jgi:hypothetical protein
LARDYDGTDDFGTVSHHASWQTAIMTVMIWHYQDVAENASQWGRDNNASSGGDEWVGMITAGQQQWKANGGVSSITSTGTLGTLAWQNVVWSRDGRSSAQADQYLNGSVDGSDSAFSTLEASPTKDLIVGQLGDSFGNNWDGQLAWLARWDIDLDSTEAAVLARGVCPFILRNDRLTIFVQQWGYASTEMDISGNNNDLVITEAVKGNTNPPVEMLENFL